MEVGLAEESQLLVNGSGGSPRGGRKQSNSGVETQGAQGRKRLGYRFEDKRGQSIMVMVVSGD